MYRGLTANTPGCVAFSLPVQRRNLRSLKVPASFRSLHSQRSARLTRSGGFEPERRPVPGHYLVPGTVLDTAEPIIRPHKARYAMAGERFGAAPGLQRQTRRRLCRQHVQTGRRLMRQTVLPTMIHGTIAPMRSESSARRLAPRGSRSARRAGLRFGLPLTPESGGPSRHPAARHARAVHTRPPPSRVPKCPTKC